jgi:hypothetical protein
MVFCFSFVTWQMGQTNRPSAFFWYFIVMDDDRLTGGALQFFHRFRVLPLWPMTAPVRG